MCLGVFLDGHRSSQFVIGVTAISVDNDQVTDIDMLLLVIHIFIV